MAGAQHRTESKLSLEIRTKSVEQTLIPLVTQITTLVNHKERSKVTEKTLKTLVCVGQAVNLAVERFVTVGETIGEENPEIKDDMCDACNEAREAGANIQTLTDASFSGPQGAGQTLAEKTAMVRAARQLLSAITKVLLLADRIVVKQIFIAKDKVLNSLSYFEGVYNFPDFVKAFRQFGNDMVELAHLTGDRQNDLKSDKQRAQMGAARTVLEKSTMMLLTSCKTSLRHPDCDSARTNREGVFRLMRKALDLVQHVVSDGTCQSNGDMSPTVNGDSGIGLATSQPTASRCIKDFEDLVEMTRVTLVGPSHQEKLTSALDSMIETSQDFTDSAYTSHDNREKIIQICEDVRVELQNLIAIGTSLNQREDFATSQELETSILKTGELTKALQKQLQDTAMDQASELFKTNEDHEILMGLKTAGVSGEVDRVEELSVKFEEHSEQLEEVCKLLRHISNTEPLVITAEHAESVIKSIGPLTLNAAQTLAQYPGSKIARENLDVFADAWESQINDLSILVKDVNDVVQGKMEKQVYLSLPRPGKHGTTSKSLRPVKLDAEEQARIAKLGLEMKLITSEMDAETDKWEEPDNDVVKRTKNMSSMAFSMYLFTRGEGPLRTTQDLFTQAEYFSEEGRKLYKTVREFAQKVPAGTPKDDMMFHVEKIPSFCQLLQVTLKAPTFGKAATFNKVDSAIQETKNLMNVVAKVVTTCFICATKYNVDYQASSPVSITNRWRHPSSSSEIRSNSSDTDSAVSMHSESLYRSASLTKSLSSYDRH
ncbi:alpha-catulin-like isoform X2 [Liolophura sinensis]|uniref:alpha-catulin-like isoform X2 n=1 Tax=Liolophura sinensis TaxID=3198878 RepID=UPI003158E1B3